ncbi:MAG: tryptophan--tRNA ligase [Cocleimonas sp.]
MSKPTVLSGIQPSGNITIGNYIGALRNWVDMQKDHDTLFALVDLHAITVRQDPKALRERCYDFISLYIACGIDPEKSTIFIQSQVPQHAELGWLLNCYTHMGELNRMTQFKEKSSKADANINVGLFDYPVLMAADILLYNADKVPVGQDQKQHLELTRDLAIRFNNQYDKKVFTVPEPFIPKSGARIMSLQDPEAKMSKSDDNENNFVSLLDPPNKILKKLKRAVTDSDMEIRFDRENKPGVSNLLELIAGVSDQTVEQVEASYQSGDGYGKLKVEAGEAIVALVEPIQERYRHIRNDQTELDSILKLGAEKASERAEIQINKVKDTIGLIV